MPRSSRPEPFARLRATSLLAALLLALPVAFGPFAVPAGADPADADPAAEAAEPDSPDAAPDAAPDGEPGDNETGPAGPHAELIAELAELIPGMLDAWHVPGAGVAIIVDGEVIHAAGYGLRDVDAGEPVTAETRFAIGSISKSFTAALIAAGVERGEFDWDTPVREILPEFRLMDETASRDATLSDLLSHMTGLPRHDLLWYGRPDATRAELVAALEHLEPSLGFREGWQYNNLMYLTAGYAAGRAAGSTWEELLQDRLLTPLKMTRTTPGSAPLRDGANVAKPYVALRGPVSFATLTEDVLEEETAEPSTGEEAESGDAEDADEPESEEEEGPRFRELPVFTYDAAGPAGTIVSTPTDMARWLQMHIDLGGLDGEQILKPGSVLQLGSPRVVIPAQGGSHGEATPYKLYARGWMAETYHGVRHINHGGNINGYSAFAGFMPDKKIGVVVLTNANGTPVPNLIASTIYDRLLEEEPVNHSGRALMQVASMRMFAAQAIRSRLGERKADAPRTHPAEAYAGVFEHPAYGRIRIRVADDGETLVAEYNDLGGELRHWHYNTFVTNADLPTATQPGETVLKVRFGIDIGGDISSLHVQLEAALGPMEFARIADPELITGELLDRYAGDYTGFGQRAQVVRRGDRLILLLPGQEHELKPLRRDLFTIGDLDGYRVRFVMEDGAVTQMVFEQPNGNFPFTRAPEPDEGEEAETEPPADDDNDGDDATTPDDDSSTPAPAETQE
jgi:CubicO group peptidase (beta-lactamase class C family)